ncbi:MAG TPA: DUF3667 domain-containing protein [Chitinophagaceae bacterium]|nr:DUF3667 domain-containing protein [Chitinophagaceae bacterium]
MQQPANCLNCGNLIQVNELFCPGCGQSARTSRITNRQLVRDFLTTLVKVDRGILRLIIGLAVSPGITAAEYVAGKRKKYFNPFGFLAICIAFMLFLSNWIQPFIDLAETNPEKLSLINDDELRYRYLLALERLDATERFVNKNLNLISVFITPYFAFFLWLMFPRRGRNMAEIFIAYIFFTGFANAASALFVYPLIRITQGDILMYNVVLNGNLLLQTVYFAWGFRTFFGYHGAGGFVRVLGALLLIGLIGLIIVLLGYYFYILQGDYRLVPLLGN